MKTSRSHIIILYSYLISRKSFRLLCIPIILIALLATSIMLVKASQLPAPLTPDANGIIHYPAQPKPIERVFPSRVALLVMAAELNPMYFNSTTYGIYRDITNTGTTTLTWISIYTDNAWVTVTPNSLVIPPGETRTLTVYVDRYGMADDTYYSAVRLQRNTGTVDFFSITMDAASFAQTVADFGCITQATPFSMEIDQYQYPIPFKWLIQSQSAWFKNVSPTSGTIPSGSGLSTIHVDFTVDPTGQPAGLNTGYMVWTTTMGHYVFPFQVTFGCGSLPDISIDEISFYNINKPFSPNTLAIQANLRNNGSSPANNVIVKFYSGDPDNGGIQIGSDFIGGYMAPGSSWGAISNSDWVTQGNAEDQAFYVRAVLDGQTDANPSNNTLNKIVDYYYVDFRYDKDAYNFPNWGIQMEDVSNDLTLFIDENHPDDISAKIMFPVVFPVASLLLENGGHCYGMSATSILYKKYPELIPPMLADDHLVYSLTLDEARANIQYYHRQQIPSILERRINEAVGFNAQTEYENVLHSIRDLRSPIMLLLYKGLPEGGGHAVVAYKVVDQGDKKLIFLYDVNHPLPSTNLFIADYATIELSTNSFDYAGSYDKFIARSPFMTPSDEGRLILNEFYYWVLRRIQASGFIRIFLGSPVKPLITDQYGRRIGYSAGIFINEIPGATVQELGEKKVFDVPQNLTYTLSTTGTGNGTMALSLQIPLFGNSIRSVDYFSVPVSTGSIANVHFSQSNSDWNLVNSGYSSQQPDENRIEHVTFSISGNAGIAGATLNYLDQIPKSVTSGPDGSYSITVPNSWSGTITPVKTGYTFDPPSRPYSKVKADQTGQNYTASLYSPRTYLPLLYKDFASVPPPLTVDVKVNAIDGPVNLTTHNTFPVSWTSTNATSCTGSGAMTGRSGTSGSYTDGPKTAGNYTYAMTCTNNGGSASDNVWVSIFSATTAINSGARHTCALLPNGGVKCWGMNYYGELGDGTTTERHKPVNVIGLGGGVSTISAGWAHTCALMQTGGVMCWGYNDRGQLGDGTTINRYAPVAVTGLASGVSAISARGGYTCALLQTGEVKCWGNNYSGQLGDGTTTNKYTPVAVVGLPSGVSAISAGDSSTCALMQTGGVKCWGNNSLGQLGDGTTINKNTPVDVIGLGSSVSAISVGREHTCALMQAGGVMCWGGNFNGEIGDGTTTAKYTPVAVTGLASGIVSISLGDRNTCALTQSGAVKCWGLNDLGQLGDGTSIDKHTPVNVFGLTSGVSTISTGAWHTCALKPKGMIKCWGWNAYGQLGDGTTSNRLKPVSVIGFP